MSNTHERFEFSRIGCGEDEFAKAVKDAKAMIKVMQRLAKGEDRPVTYMLSVSVGERESRMVVPPALPLDWEPASPGPNGERPASS